MESVPIPLISATTFVAMAGLMQTGMEVLFTIRAESEQEARERIGGDAWRDTGHAEIAPVEPIDIRFGAPPPA